MLTRSGLGVALGGVVMTVLGMWWRYEELVVFGAASLAAVAVGLIVARVPARVVIHRLIDTPRVARGDPVRVEYVATNGGRGPAGGSRVTDRCGAHTVSVDLPRLDAGARARVRTTIPTDRRGVFDVGPAFVERVDPLGLGAGRRDLRELGVVVVHPRVHALLGPYGDMHTVHDEAVVRRSATDPLSGFVSLRAYVDGDDPRMIHWPTTARVGELMVREHVELRRPEFTVVLDAAASAATADDFEEMADVVASIAVHAIRNGVTVALRTTAREHLGRPAFHTETALLDFLTPIRQVGPDGAAPLSELFRSGFDHTTVVMVTGPTGPSTMLASDSVSIVRVGAGSGGGPGVSLAVDDAVSFARRWRPWQ